jgi:hypothetical protein
MKSHLVFHPALHALVVSTGLKKEKEKGESN